MPQAATKEQQETEELSEQSMSTAVDLVLERARAKSLSPVTRYGGYDEALGIHNARIKQQLLEQFRGSIEALAAANVPGMPPVDLDVFHLYTAATAIPLLTARARHAAGEPPPKVQKSMPRLMTIRSILLPTLEGAAAAGQVPASRVNAILAGRGYRNYVMDVVEGVDITDEAPHVFGNHPTITPELKREARTLAYEILPELPVEGVQPEPAATPEHVTKTRDERNLGYAYLLALDAEADRLLAIFLGKEAENVVPKLQQGRNAGKTSSAPAKQEENSGE